jgi:hypothetical protein
MRIQTRYLGDEVAVLLQRQMVRQYRHTKGQQGQPVRQNARQYLQGHLLPGLHSALLEFQKMRYLLWAGLPK